MPKFQPLNGVCRKTVTDELPMLNLVDCYPAISSAYDLVWCVVWTSGAAITYQVVRDHLGRPETFEIAYQITTGDGSIESRKQVLPFTSVPQKLGGVRWWLVCSCGRKCRQLFLKPESYDWRCRKCCDLLYRSQLLRNTRLGKVWAPIDKVLRQQRKPLHFPAAPADPKPFTPTL